MEKIGIKKIVESGALDEPKGKGYGKSRLVPHKPHMDCKCRLVYTKDKAGQTIALSAPRLPNQEIEPRNLTKTNKVYGDDYERI